MMGRVLWIFFMTHELIILFLHEISLYKMESYRFVKNVTIYDIIKNWV